ncbi:MAG: hypothetical protein ACJ8C4_10530 [Gemmataceae bacterium]
MPDLPVITTQIIRLSATIAEVLIHADFDHGIDAETTLAGRLYGPRCPGTETIEIAYPIRAIPAEPAHPQRRSARVVIPEPNLWEKQTPFTYVGTVEISTGGTKTADIPIELGLRQGSEH